MTDVSIILINYNTKDLTVQAINSIYEQTNDLSYEIIVVDNNSQDGSVEAIKENFENVKVIVNKENLGFGTANNIGIKQASGKYIFCLNTDTLLLNNAIKILYDFMEKHPNVACCGGNLYDKEHNHVFSHGIFLTPFAKFIKTFGLKYLFPKEVKRLKADYTNKLDEIKPVEFICGADLMLRKSILDEVGTFNEQFFLYYEEVELQKRIKNANYEIYIVPSAKIVHLESASSTNKLRKKSIFLKSEYIYLKNCYSHNFLDKIFIKMIYLISLIPKLITGNKDIKNTYEYILLN